MVARRIPTTPWRRRAPADDLTTAFSCHRQPWCQGHPPTREGWRPGAADIARMRIVLRFVLFTTAVLAVVTPLSSSAIATTKPVGAPTSLRAFLLSPSEPVTHVFPRTPAFAWKPVRGATCYEFELATSRAFGENVIVWSNVRYGVKPGVGSHRCRRSSPDDGGSSRSDARICDDRGFEHERRCGRVYDAHDSRRRRGSGRDIGDRAPTRSRCVGRHRPALVHRPAVRPLRARPRDHGQRPHRLEHAVRVQHAVAERSHSARVTAGPHPLDERKRGDRLSGLVSRHPKVLLGAHERGGRARVLHAEELVCHGALARTCRAPGVRRRADGLPAVSYGPWSPVYTSTNPTPDVTPIATRMALSDGISDGTKQSAHALMPGLAFNGDAALDQHVYSVLPTLSNYPLYRVYAATDRDCVNIVFRSSIVGSPAYAPRTSGALQLPLKEQNYVRDLFHGVPDVHQERRRRRGNGLPIGVQ